MSKGIIRIPPPTPTKPDKTPASKPIKTKTIKVDKLI
jgi:hypothetical protein